MHRQVTVQHVMVNVVFLLLADDQQVALIHVYLSNTVYSMNGDNESFDKIHQRSMGKMHMVHFLARMDQYQA